MQWRLAANCAMYDGADWTTQVGRLSNQTPESAQTYADSDDRITFFFIMSEPMYLPVHGAFNPGDAVFFTGTWWPGSAPQANIYIKPAPHGRIIGTSVPSGSGGWVSFQSKLKVPFVAPPLGTIFAWPGLQPGGLNFMPIGNGVLQPVLTYGPSCAPDPNGVNLNHSWWISGQYVNTDQNCQVPSLQGCLGGDVMLVNSGDELLLEIGYDSTNETWVQTVTNATANPKMSVSYSVSLAVNANSQEQNYAYFCLETPNFSALTQCVSIYDAVLTVGTAQETLGQDLKDSACVQDVSVNATQTTLSIGRVMIYNPIINVGSSGSEGPR